MNLISFELFLFIFLSEDLSHEFPVTETTSSYLNASSSLRDHRARIVTLQLSLKALGGSERFRDKIKRLLRHRYNAAEDVLTIVADTCPYRSQNQEYASYLLTALFHESRKVRE